MKFGFSVIIVLFILRLWDVTNKRELFKVNVLERIMLCCSFKDTQTILLTRPLNFLYYVLGRQTFFDIVNEGKTIHPRIAA